MTGYIKPPRSEDCEWRSGPPPEIAEYKGDIEWTDRWWLK